MENEEQKEVLSTKSLIARFFLHGIAFTVLLQILAVAWAFIAVALVEIGLIIGLIIGIVLLFFIVGGLNIFLTESIWHVSIEHEWKRVILQGLILFIVLIIVHIPSLFIELYVPNLVTFAVFFLAYCFIDGLVARRTALIWKARKRSPYDGLLHDTE